MEEEGRFDAERFVVMNKTTEDFISEMKQESDWHKMIFRYLLHCLSQYLPFQGICPENN